MAVKTRRKRIGKRIGPPQRNEQARPITGKSSIKWWVSTIGLTFFPTFSLMLICILRNTPFEFIDLIKNGEIILASLLIVTSTLIDCYNDAEKKKSSKAEGTYYSLIGVVLLDLITYTTIRTDPESKSLTVYIATVLSVIISIFVSWYWNQLGEVVEEDEQFS